MDNMDKQYNLYADKYDVLLNATPYRPYVEAYSFFGILGDVRGLSVLDLATGTGYYARACAKMGAEKVVGIDISDQMIAVAEQAETAEPLKVTYHTGDATQYKADELFDVAIAVYLLHYSSTHEVLQAMCKNIAANIKSGGRFVTYQMNPQFPPTAGYHKKYGLTITQPQYKDGEHLTMELELGGQSIPAVSVYRWNKETIEDALTAAGFESIKWHQPSLSLEWDTSGDQGDFFVDYLAHPHAIILEAHKP